MNDLMREMNKEGHLIYEANFKKNPISGVRTGSGVMQARAKTAMEVDVIRNKLEKKGITANVSGGYKPTWKC